jgi:hypothetical protein
MNDPAVMFPEAAFQEMAILGAGRMYSGVTGNYHVVQKRADRKQCQASPITRLSRAASTTALVTSYSALTPIIRSIWVRRRVSSRKLPPVIRMIAATVS